MSFSRLPALVRDGEIRFGMPGTPRFQMPEELVDLGPRLTTVIKVEEEIEIHLTNDLDREIDITVTEDLLRSATWEILTSSHSWVQAKDRRIEFLVRLEPDRAQTIRYRVRYDY